MSELIHFVFSNSTIPSFSIPVNFITIFCIALAGCWEIWEFTGDRLFGFTSQNDSLIDTMMDIICGTLGGIISLIPIYRFSKGKRNSFLEKVTKEVM